MKICHDIFLTCAVLHKRMLSEMVREGTPSCLQRGIHLASDGMWLEGPSESSAPVRNNASAKRLMLEFDRRRTLLSHHLQVWREKNKNDISNANRN